MYSLRLADRMMVQHHLATVQEQKENHPATPEDKTEFIKHTKS